jgi:DNA-binding MarR family transcriptional regulator
LSLGDMQLRFSGRLNFTQAMSFSTRKDTVSSSMRSVVISNSLTFMLYNITIHIAMSNSISYSASMDDVLANLPGYALRRAAATIQAEFAALLEPLGLRPTDASILVLIDANPGITQSALGLNLGVQRANMVPLVARLEDSGYISRIAVDGRSFGLELTNAGAEVCGTIKEAIKIHQQQINARIPEVHRDHLVPALKALWK